MFAPRRESGTFGRGSNSGGGALQATAQRGSLAAARLQALQGLQRPLWTSLWLLGVAAAAEGRGKGTAVVGRMVVVVLLLLAAVSDSRLKCAGFSGL